MSSRFRGRASVASRVGARLLVATAAVAVSLSALAAELSLIASGRGVGGATTLETALVQAYQNNPQLNAQRAATRAVDENVPTALSGYRPRATGTASVTENYLETLVKNPVTTGPATYTKSQGAVAVSSAGMTVTQTLLNGFQTANRTRQAEGQVFSARETLRTTEQNVLLNAATAT
jgi:outer membrane protein